MIQAPKPKKENDNNFDFWVLHFAFLIASNRVSLVE